MVGNVPSRPDRRRPVKRGRAFVAVVGDDDAMTAVCATDQLTPLGLTGWTLWRDAALRAAGFPAERFLDLCDHALAAAADGLDDGVPATHERYATVFAAAVERLTMAIRRIARDGAFREAVTWQNPALVRDCLDKAAAGEPRNVRGRYHELAVANYLQRYCLKNDTIGFFGPVGWARLGSDDTGVAVTAQPGLLARRTTYFENWAIEAVADAIAGRPDVFPWLRVRREPSAAVSGAVVRLPFRKPAMLSARELRVLSLCDGDRTVRDITGDPPDPVMLAALLQLRQRGVVRVDLRGPMATWPERELAAHLDAIADPAVRARAWVPLEEMVRARDAVAAAAGDADRLARASQTLAATFERATGNPATRRAGGVYAARTLVYEDTVRAVDVHLGRRVTDHLAAPLGLMLDSAGWLADAIADRFEAKARELLDRELARSGGRAMPLLQMLTSVMPELGRDASTARSEIVDTVVADFQRRWRQVLGLADGSDGTCHHQVTAAGIAERVAREFPLGLPRWSGARWHSPDIMFTAADPSALANGDLDFVLSELHCATNTLLYRFFAEQHPDRDRLRAATAAVQSGDRLILIPGMDSPLTTSRMSPAAELMLPSYTYLCLGAESLAPPAGATVISVMDLDVVPAGETLRVRHRPSGDMYDFLEAAGEPLSVLISNAFRPFDGARRQPRISIDRLVVGRAAWTFPATEPAWAFVNDERRRYALARRWRAGIGLPERGFVRVPVERKPMAVDFRSLPLVNLLAKSIRRTAEAGAGDVTITEMLPDVDGLWLRDADGRSYTAELRIVAVRQP